MEIIVVALFLFLTTIVFLVARQRLFLNRFGRSEYFNNKLLLEFPYYNNLSYLGKAKFIRRLEYFLTRKEFIGLKGLEITDEMKILISISAVQLTFGLKDYRIANFHKIFIYPGEFYYRVSKQFHKGHTALQKFLSLSWKDFYENYKSTIDKKNLALHEFTHALEFNLLYGSRSDSGFADYYASWVEVEETEIEKIRSGESSYLRKYSGKNIHEFFATAVEHFFESPNDFKKEASELYLQLCILLNQDPANNKMDYVLQKKSKDLIDFRKSYQHRTWHWSGNILLIGGLLSTITLFLLLPMTIISIEKVVMYISLFALIASLVQYRYFRNNFWFGYLFYIIYNIIGVGFTLFATLLILNFTFPLNKAEVNDYQIIEYLSETYSGRTIDVKICCPEDEGMQIVSVDISAINRSDSETVRVKTSNGILGYTVYLGNKIVP